ncbi:MAG TPA: CxxxxCH/CxxCH domain-containing protein [Deltaproteobacteria bacterium]|nr:CxxxxCH/CxxCH domain-containing protein [Deltaproteobacteria bacterium]
MLWMMLVAGCGGKWSEQDFDEVHANFPLACAHETATCEGCHAPGKPIEAVDAECIACHEEARPSSHDPETTNVCTECHAEQVDTCGWGSASPHPSGFDDPELHGLAFNLHDMTEGDCFECHGEELTGNTAGGCDDCHTREGHPDWRTECTFCHGGVEDTTGAPPQDIDNSSTDISLRSHTAHVSDDGDYRPLPCRDCHLDHTDVLDPGHTFDLTAAMAEFEFSRGPGSQTVYDGSTCVDNYCHGAGQRHDGVIDDSDPEMSCESCHATTSGWQTMSGLHETHLQESIVCNDCHAAVIDAEGGIATPNRHVDGTRDVAFVETTISSENNGGTCQGVCHGFDHDNTGWGHPPGYDAPDLHGMDAKLQVLECGSCHGEDWTGGVAQGCDDCHAQEGNPDWRTDCTYCHGGNGTGNTGAPPQDIDDNTDEATISFGAHPEHVAGGGLGHPAYGCEQCHRTPDRALSPGHMIDGSIGVAETDLTAGLSAEGGWDMATSTCSNMYCHGDGRAPSGDITDGNGPLDCDSCHAATTNLDQMSGTHETHLSVSGVTCADCHQPIVDASNTITEPNRHVDGRLDLDVAATGYDPASSSCTISCHGEDHSGYGWLGPHPDGYDAPEMHGAEALSWVLDCNSCHGADLQGGSSGQGCDDCHAQEGSPDWRSDCTFCHGGANGDTTGAPPQDLDNQANEDLISFKAHPEHIDGDIHPAYGCETCHGNNAASYSDALTDPGHWIDGTSGFAENVFTGLAAGTSYAANTCSNNQCHGDGQVNGSQSDGTNALSCNGCHSYDVFLSDLSGTHARHLGEAGITCADCHSPVVDASGNITAPNQHVDGDIDFDVAATGYNAGSDSCTISCHGADHTGWAWEGGHPPGYDAPEVHGTEALFVQQDCNSCHGADLQGGSSGQGCDTCHDPGWRSDCTFCHGGNGTGNTGMPPQDLDNTTNEDQITFKAHPEHGDNDEHPRYDCDECHGTASLTYSDALTDPGHWFDGSTGRAEVIFDGLSSGGTYNNGTCNNNYCHGTGEIDGSVSDGITPLGCADCHLSPPDSATGTGEHRKHKHDRVSCDWCHDSVAVNNVTIQNPDLHVDGLNQVVYSAAANQWGGMSYNPGTHRCDGECHAGGDDKNHQNKEWK